MHNNPKKQKGRGITHGNAATGHTTSGSDSQKSDQNNKTYKYIDFDGTLAKELIPYSPMVAGPPIKRSIQLVKKWMKDNEKVVIFTSRVYRGTHTRLQIRYARKLITAWCKQYLGKSFPITSEKHPQAEIWDNKAHRVETNTGRILAGSKLYQIMASSMSSEDKSKALMRFMVELNKRNRKLQNKAYLKGRQEGGDWARDKHWSTYAE